MPGAGQGDSPEGLSARQREIIAGTYKVQRDKAQSGEQQVREDLAILALTQGRLKERLNELVQQMVKRNAAQMDSTFVIIQKELTDAIPEMKNEALIVSAEAYLLRIRFADDDPTEVQRAERLLQDRVGPLRVVTVGPDGAIYFLTDTSVGKLSRVTQ